MKKIDIVRQILSGKKSITCQPSGAAFAPTNIALCKYWGKRNIELNLPVTSSLSISLGDKGATTTVREIESSSDKIALNEQDIAPDSAFGRRLIAFLDLFRPNSAVHYQVSTCMNIPVAAGLASSACGFAALVQALNALYQWQLDHTTLSILARLGSGSAARSIWHGFVEWQAGDAEDGMDSYGIALPIQWPELCIGLLVLNSQQKPLSSREAMQCTVQTSRLYSAWPEQVAADMQRLKSALQAKDFSELGKVAENNALTMHATMMSAWPPVIYSQPDTLRAVQQVWQLRAEGVAVYYTQDAGPNLKLLFLEEAQAAVKAAFPHMIPCQPFKE